MRDGVSKTEKVFQSSEEKSTLPARWCDRLQCIRAKGKIHCMSGPANALMFAWVVLPARWCDCWPTCWCDRLQCIRAKGKIHCVSCPANALMWPCTIFSILFCPNLGASGRHYSFVYVGFDFLSFFFNILALIFKSCIHNEFSYESWVKSLDMDHFHLIKYRGYSYLFIFL
jgi:hypothetical protein